MSQTLAIFGATGQQGGAVMHFVLNDPELSQQYRVRAIARDVNSTKLQPLQGRIEIAQGDVEDRASLETALAGVHSVFIMTSASYRAGGDEAEFQMAKRMADVAVDKGAKQLIFSTLPAATRLSGGKYTKLVQYDGKAKAEAYMRTLPVQTAFVSLGYFMQNFHNFPALNPKKQADGSFVLSRPVSPASHVCLVDVAADMGKYVGAALADPAKFNGRTLYASTEMISMDEMAATIGKATGNKVVYRQCTAAEYSESLPFAPEILTEAAGFAADFDFYGPDAQLGLDWTAANARGRLTTLEEHLRANPIVME